MRHPLPLSGRCVVITRPSVAATPLARQVRAQGGVPLRLPGLALRGIGNEATALALRQALRAPLRIFTSPAAVSYAARLAPLAGPGATLALGQATAAALRRRGVDGARMPTRQDSEGLLALAVLQRVDGIEVALIGAAGGRGLIAAQLRQRGAALREVHVYQRVAPRLDHRHRDALARLSADACVLWSSAEAMERLQRTLAPPLWARLCQVQAIVSSDRLQLAAQAAGFTRVRRAHSALARDLLVAAAEP